MEHSLKAEFIRRWVLADFTHFPKPTFESFGDEFPEARTVEFALWVLRFAGRQARRRRRD